MLRILDLPAEVLCMILTRDHLSEDDLYEATLVCKAFHESAMRSLYRILGQRLCRMTSAFNKMWHKQRMVECWARTLKNHDKIGIFVKELHLCELSISQPEIAQEWLLMQPGIMYMLHSVPNLQFLHIQNGWGKELDYDHLKLIYLQTVMIQDFSYEIISQLLCQPQMKRIWLYSIGNALFWRRPAIAQPWSVIASPQYRATAGKELVLNSVKISAQEMRTLVLGLRDLESFIFIRDGHDCEHDTKAEYHRFRCALYRLGDFARILEPTREFLEKLTLLWNGSFYCRFDDTVLGSLVHFDRLKTLRIEDTFLLGNHWLCPEHRAALGEDGMWAIRKTSDIAKLLPSSIERLDLHVRDEGIWGDYIAGLIDGLGWELGRLTRLNHFTIEEATGRDYKFCKECEPKINSQSSLNSMIWDSRVTPNMIRKWQRKFAQLGIRLDYTKLAQRLGYRWNGHLHFAKVYSGAKIGGRPQYLHAPHSCGT